MSFNKKIKYYLVHSCNMTNSEAQTMIDSGELLLNGTAVLENKIIGREDELIFRDKILKHKPLFKYILYHKPVGLVSSLHPEEKEGLYEIFKEQMPLYVAGRLDKNSEGLLILTDDGKWLKNITNPESNKQKEYIVTVNQPIDDIFIQKMKEGVDIGFYTTKACVCEKIDEISFKIILTEGKNKQIRRMCKKLDYQVIKLKRIRIDVFELGNLNAGEYKLTNFSN